MVKKLYKQRLTIDQIRCSAAHRVGCEKRAYYINTTVYLIKKKYLHRLESDSARNNIHPNNKHKSDITKESTRKITFEYDQQV